MYREMYLVLFRAITKAVRAMEEENYGAAKELLKCAQIQSEEIYIDADRVSTAPITVFEAGEEKHGNFSVSYKNTGKNL